MEPLKKVQVEGFLMFAEPQDLFGNLDELCYVSLGLHVDDANTFTTGHSLHDLHNISSARVHNVRVELLVLILYLSFENFVSAFFTAAFSR